MQNQQGCVDLHPQTHPPEISVVFVFCLLLHLFFLFCDTMGIQSLFLGVFKVPEIPKKAVSEAKVPLTVPKKPEPPPAKGISTQSKSVFLISCVSLILDVMLVYVKYRCCPLPVSSFYFCLFLCHNKPINHILQIKSLKCLTYQRSLSQKKHLFIYLKKRKLYLKKVHSAHHYPYQRPLLKIRTII